MELENIIEKQGIMKRYAYALKAFIIGVLILVLLIPAVMIQNLISERQRMQHDATAEISAKWANAQTLTGPLLIVPYTEVNERGEEVVKQAVFLPDQLTVNGELIPEIRKRGIYEVAVYNSRLLLNGVFSTLPPSRPEHSCYQLPLAGGRTGRRHYRYAGHRQPEPYLERTAAWVQPRYASCRPD